MKCENCKVDLIQDPETLEFFCPFCGYRITKGEIDG